MTFLIYPVDIRPQPESKARDEREYFAKLQSEARARARRRSWRRLRARFRIWARRRVKAIEAKPYRLSKIT